MARSVTELLELTKAALLEEAHSLHISGADRMNKQSLAEAIVAAEAAEQAVDPDGPEDEQTAARVAALVDDIRTAFRAGAKKAVVKESDEKIQKFVEMLLEPEERSRVMWGGSSTRHVIG